MEQLKQLGELRHWIAGLQWFFFIFVNIIIVPIAVAEAFELGSAETISTIRMSFIVTGLACLAQGILGHGRPLLEGQSGVWMGIFLTLVTTTAAQGIPLYELGGSLALGVIIAGVITIIVGIIGVGPQLAKLFNPTVMGVFTFLLGVTLLQIFFQGMLGIPFGVSDDAKIDVPVASLAILIAIIVIIISIKSRPGIRSYALLIGIIVGWIVYLILFGSDESVVTGESSLLFFPLGKLTWNTGIVLTAVFAGLLNLSNTFGALKGLDDLENTETTSRDYRRTFSITGLASISSGVFGLVPYAPYVSSLGFLQQTNLFDRVPFFIGSFLFFLLGVFQPISAFFAAIPLSIGSAVLFVAYLQMFNSSWNFLKNVQFNTMNVYRIAIPLFVGIIIMTFPPTYFESLPSFIRPFLSNGLLVGIFLSIVLENMIRWDRVGN